MDNRLRIIVTGLAITYPFGGVFWDYMQYVLGFQRLGHDVLYLEDTGQWCYRPAAATFAESGAQNAASFGQAVRELDPALSGRWFYQDAAGATYGLSREDVARFARSADLFLNISAAALLRDEYVSNARLVFVDSDPLFTQASVPAYVEGTIDPRARIRVDAMREHDVFFSFGENIGKAGCTIPTDLFPWQPTRQPIVLEAFAPARVPIQDRRTVLTTVGSWEPAKAPVEVRGVCFRGKSPQFERFIELPERSPVPVELAFSGDLPRDILEKHGWVLADPLAVSGNPWSYRDYLAHSLAEWSVAKDAYVASRSGWFSCRSACYLATGVPVIVQDTGFGDVLPTGSGVLPFSTLDDAISAIEDVASRYEHHCLGAREVASEYFDATKVLSNMLDVVFATPAHA